MVKRWSARVFSSLFYSQSILVLLSCALNLAAQCIVIGPVCGRVCIGRAVSEPYYSQRAQCLRFSERFFIDAVFPQEQRFGPRTAKSQPIWIKFCTYLYCCKEYTCGPT